MSGSRGGDKENAIPFENRAAKKPAMPTDASWAKLPEWKAFDDFDLSEHLGFGDTSNVNLAKMRPKFDEPQPMRCTAMQ